MRDMRDILLFGLIVLVLCGCNGPRERHKLNNKVEPGMEAEMSNASDYYAEEDSDFYVDDECVPWEEISMTEKPQSLNFEHWLEIMLYIKFNNWAHPTAKMLENAGLVKLQEIDSIDGGIKSVNYVYGRDVKSEVSEDGGVVFVPVGPHAVIFRVDAYTSSGALVAFRSAVDLKDFIEQAVKRGVVEYASGDLVVCDRPMSPGIHQLKKMYDSSETKKGKYKEAVILAPCYKPDAEWQVCDVALDFLRHRIDVVE